MNLFINFLDFREVGVFNSREIAVFFCAFLLLIYCLYHKSVRDAIVSVIKAMFVNQLNIIYILLLIYSLIPIITLFKIGLWRIELTKEAVFWMLFSALPTLYNINKADKKFFLDAFLDNVKFTIVIEFITTQYTFNIFIEMIIVIFSVLAGGIIAYSDKKEEYKYANKFTKIVMYILGIFVLIFSLYKFYDNINSILNINKLEEFSLPIILGIWFIPFLYLVHLYNVYESVFLGMKYAISDREIYSYAKRRAFFCFLFNTSSLKSWKDSLFTSEVKSKEGVLISLLDIKRLELIEKNPPKIEVTEGWSPYESKDFLVNHSINTNYYKRFYDNEWQAISNYIKLNNEIIDNNIAYYVSGDNTVATQLKIVLNIYSKVEEESAINKYIECVKSLYKSALNENIPVYINQKSIKKMNNSFHSLGKTISFSKIEHQGPLKGYTLSFTIKHER